MWRYKNMMWNHAVVTNQGLLLLQAVMDGRQLFLDHAMGGTGHVTPDTLKEQTALANQRQKFAIIQQKNVENGKQVGSLITNTDITEKYNMTQFGIYAHIDNEPPVLMAILQDDEGMRIPSRTDIPEFHFVFYAIINFSNEAIWHFVIDSTLNKPRVEGVDPTKTTPGTVPQFYVNVLTGALFVCIEIRGTDYIWLPIVNGRSLSDFAFLGASYLGGAFLSELADGVSVSGVSVSPGNMGLING
jgi:hypothetical protein